MRFLLLCGIVTAGAIALASDIAAADGAGTLSGYLSESQLPDSTSILPPAPKPGSAQFEADRRIFNETRSLKGSERWDMARNDDVVTAKTISDDFACALGVHLNATDEPRFVRLVGRMTVDLVRATDAVKQSNKRQRPFLIDRGETCIPISREFAATYDYPSGHAAYAWALGLMLAELVPDRATQILERARAFGESRAICGVHNASAVDAGRAEGSVVVAVLHSVPEFRADLDAARTEIATARAKSESPPASCAAEAALISKPTW
jgi:acid phosphatase (class A)